MKTVKFFTLGCKVNQYETQRIRERFIYSGFREIEHTEKADVYVINTCTVTSNADRKSHYIIHYAHKQNPKAIIVVTGCYTQLDSDEIAKIPGVTHIIKNEDKYRIVELLNGQNEPDEINHDSLHTEGVNEYRDEGISSFLKHTRAFLKIQDGCVNFCSYCKVPLVRGILRSKPLNDIVKEAGRLVENGFKEIVLCGICLGAYGKDLNSKVNLVGVTQALEGIAGLLRLRLSSIEPEDVSDALIDKIANSKKLCRHLHIPLQSGDDEILKKMNRNYSRLDYFNLIKKIKSRIPEIAITTDVLVGFPGEKGFNFKNTLDLIEEVLPLKVHIFPYSRRRQTPAYDFGGNLSPGKIKIRIMQLRDIARDCSLRYKVGFTHKIMDVLIEGRFQKNPDYWQGYTDNYIKTILKSNLYLKNKLIPLKLNKISKDYFLANSG